MIIQCTKLRMTAEEAGELCKTENNGLLGKAEDWLFRRPAEADILSVRQFYYPYYCILVKAMIPSYKGIRDRAQMEKFVIDGCFGYLNAMEGIPATEPIDYPKKDIARIVITEDAAKDKIQEFIKRRIFKKYHVFPKFEFHRVELVYKPLYAVLCKRGNRKYYRIVDGEIGQKDFTFDVYYRKIRFMEEES